MKLDVTSAALIEQTTDALILFFRETEPLLPSGNDQLNALAKSVAETIGFKGKAGQTALVPAPEAAKAKQLILTGIGDAKNFHAGILEQAAAAAVRSGLAAGAQSFATASCLDIDSTSASDFQLLAGRGACWGSYKFTTFKTDTKENTPPVLTFVGEVQDRTAIDYAEIQGAALLSTADLANLPGNEAPPAKIAHWAKEMAEANGLGCEILDKEELTEKGCGAILAVSQGSAHDARMIILKHEGSNPEAQPIVLVGKTVTFDSGGISLKPGKGMGWMRYDKGGGMAVLTAMQMIAKMKTTRPVIGILGAAENMPGPEATRPGDIIKAYNGKTIEVLNTDAEGRLVLADALGLAAEMNPAAIVDLATLTGAVIGALGSAASAVLGNDDQLIQQLKDAGSTAGERLWQLPLFQEYSEDMKSDFADLSNLAKSGTAGTATAAAFLHEFVPEEIPWAHIDIAGTAWIQTAKPHQAPGATLFGARLLAQWILSQE